MRDAAGTCRTRAIFAFMFAFFTLAAPTTSRGQERAAASRLPNIIVILADDLGYGALGSFGQTKVATPQLDRMAREGTRFTAAYAGSAECAPSRCVFMTGKHTGHGRVRSNDRNQRLGPKDVTVATLLNKAGYRTGLFGKWGLGDFGTTGEPSRQGFDEWFGYLDQVHAHFHYPDYLWNNGQKLAIAENQNGKRGRHSHDLIEENAHAFIKKHRDRPFFLDLSYTIPHAELLIPEDSMAAYIGKFPETPYVGDHYASQPTPHAAYAGMITRLDRSVGRLLDLLRELGIAENTLVLFTSDNGATLAGGSDPDFFRNSGNLRGYKFQLYEGGIRVPTLAHWPGKIPAGRVVNAPWGFQDLPPTFCELAKTTPPKASAFDGQSIVPLLYDQKPTGAKPPRPPLYWEFYGREGMAQAVRDGDWKLLRNHPKAPVELYNLASDPAESQNLADARPEIRDRLLKLFDSLRTPQEPAPAL